MPAEGKRTEDRELSTTYNLPGPPGRRGAAEGGAGQCKQLDRSTSPHHFSAGSAPLGSGQWADI